MKKIWFICIFLALFICIVLVVDSFNHVNYFEGFVDGIMPDNSVPIPADKKIPDGYYKNISDTTRMYPIPSGYVATADKTSIMPISGNNTITTEPVDIPTNGIIPDGFYKISQTKMSRVPYGYSANLDRSGIVPMTKSEMYSQYANDKSNVPIRSHFHDLIQFFCPIFFFSNFFTRFVQSQTLKPKWNVFLLYAT